MRIRQNKGRRVHSALSMVFQVLPLGGSLLQKYDAPSHSFIPNRELTPLILQPQLMVSDPDGTIPTGDYASQLNNASWVLTLREGNNDSLLPATNGDDVNYTIDAATKRLTVYYNVGISAVLHVKFSGDYLDTRRSETHHVEWERDMSTEAQTDLNVTLETGRWKHNVRLMPWKKWGQFGIPVQLKNGPDDIADNNAVYQWQWWDEQTQTFSEDFTDCPWLVSGEQTKQIVVDQNYIQKVVLRCKAYAYGNQHTMQYFTTRLRRWYGQFDYEVDFLRGKYVTNGTNTIVLNAWVANAKGNISNPLKYFDMELFFAAGNEDFRSVGYGEEAIIVRNDLKTGEPKCGILLRELSAFMPLADDDGNILCLDNGTPLFAQFPTKSREV